MTDVPPDSASHFLSACQRREMFAGPIVGSPPVHDCLPRKLSAIGCVRGGKREGETAIVNKTSIPSIFASAFQLHKILGAAGDLANVDCWATKEGIWAKKEGVWAKNEKVAKNAFCINLILLGKRGKETLIQGQGLPGNGRGPARSQSRKL